MTRSGTRMSETIGSFCLLCSITATPSLSEPDPTVVGIAIKSGFLLLMSDKKMALFLLSFLLIENLQ